MENPNYRLRLFSILCRSLSRLCMSKLCEVSGIRFNYFIDWLTFDSCTHKRVQNIAHINQTFDNSTIQYIALHFAHVSPHTNNERFQQSNTHGDDERSRDTFGYTHSFQHVHQYHSFTITPNRH